MSTWRVWELGVAKLAHTTNARLSVHPEGRAHCPHCRPLCRAVNTETAASTHSTVTVTHARLVFIWKDRTSVGTFGTCLSKAQVSPEKAQFKVYFVPTSEILFLFLFQTFCFYLMHSSTQTIQMRPRGFCHTSNCTITCFNAPPWNDPSQQKPQKPLQW